MAKTTDEITHEAKYGKVLKVTRLQMLRKDVKTDSMSVVLELVENVMPEKVRMGHLSYDVKEFIPAPLLCFKCQ